MTEMEMCKWTKFSLLFDMRGERDEVGTELGSKRANKRSVWTSFKVAKRRLHVYSSC